MHHTQKIYDDNKILLYAWFAAMFTRVDMIFSTDISRDDLPEIAEEIKHEIERVEHLANRFDENSELSRINKSAFEIPCRVSPELFLIIEACVMYHSKTQGLFDITVNSNNQFKDGISNILLDKTAQTIRFLSPDVSLDLSGFIKGYVLRAIRELLHEKKINNALINMGNSSILALGDHPHGPGWKISIPESENQVEHVLYNECLTTSGNKEHTKWPVLQPQTRQVIERNQVVSVITDDPATGEVLSTALYIATEKEREMLLNQFSARLVNF